MKVKITASDGELEERLEDVVKAVRMAAGHAHDREPRKLDIPALQGGVDRASRAADRIKRKMLANMLEVLKEAR